MASKRFEDVRASAPDLANLTADVKEMRARMARSTDANELRALVTAWDAKRREIETWKSLVYLRFQQDTRDAEAKQARDECDTLAPKITELEVAVKRDLLEHALRPELEAHFGAQAFALWQVDVLSFDPMIKDDLVEESRLEAEYVELLAGADFEFRGESYNFSTIAKFKQDPDRATRHEAAQLTWRWFESNGEQLDRIYGDLVRLRTSMATKLGRANFVELGYERMSRVDYDRTDVERFRAQVREHVVPLCAELARRQAERLGLEGLKLWDESIQDLAGNPKPGGDHDWMMANAQGMFDAVGYGLGDFFRLMQEGEFLDLRSRKGKAGGGFCTSLATAKMPFVFANFNGTKGDVEVFTHEIGHAFQCYSSREMPLHDYLWPTMESCEIHSMSLEFLTLPHLDRFFGEDAARFERVHVTESLMFLPYGTAVDEFQHWVYDHPEATPAERHAAWRSLERIYLPWRDHGDIARTAAGGFWQLQRHIYVSPFYYIDYVLAQTCALQFWARAEQDRAEAMRAYVALCERGGEAPFQDLARGAGLVSPFDDGCLEGAVAHAARSLGV